MSGDSIIASNTGHCITQSFVLRVSLVCVDVNLLQYKYNREVYYSPNLRSPIYSLQSHSYQVQFSCTPVLINDRGWDVRRVECGRIVQPGNEEEHTIRSRQPVPPLNLPLRFCSLM